MKYVKLTLETVGANDYPALRTEMVDDLVQIELDADMASLMEHYEQLVEEMYTNMDDDDLQAHHDKHIEYLKEFPSGDYKTEEEYENEIKEEAKANEN
jgi:predicted membrane-bound spermidine synthase